MADFGAKGDFVTDDTAAFTQAIAAAVAVNGDVIIPPPPGGGYILSNGFSLPAQTSGNPTQIRILASGPIVSLYYQGTNPFVFQATGLVACDFENINVILDKSVKNCVVWDIIPTQTSINHLAWRKCRVQFGTGGNNIAWRTGQVQGGSSDIAVCTWDQCEVQSLGGTTAAQDYGDIAWQIGGPQNKQFLFSDCSVSGCFYRFLFGPIYTNGVPQNVPGQGIYPGGGSATFVGCGGSNCFNDFVFLGGGRFTIDGDRGENGQRYIQTGIGVHGYSINVTGTGCEMQLYAQNAPDGTGACILLTGSDTVALNGLAVGDNNAPLDKRMITVQGSKARLEVRNSEGYFTDPFYTVQPDTSLEVKGTKIQATDGSISGFTQSVG